MKLHKFSRSWNKTRLAPNTAPLQNHRMYRKVYLSRGYRIIYTLPEPHRQIYIHRVGPHDDVYSGFGD